MEKNEKTIDRNSRLYIFFQQKCHVLNTFLRTFSCHFFVPADNNKHNKYNLIFLLWLFHCIECLPHLNLLYGSLSVCVDLWSIFLLCVCVFFGLNSLYPFILSSILNATFHLKLDNVFIEMSTDQWADGIDIFILFHYNSSFWINTVVTSKLKHLADIAIAPRHPLLISTNY